MIRALLLALATCSPPERAQCPVGWFAEGVRPDGSTTCVHAPPRHCGDAAGSAGEQAPCVYEERRMAMRVYCTGGAHPIIVDERTVGCQR
jgi:hypothetical protein